MAWALLGLLTCGAGEPMVERTVVVSSNVRMVSYYRVERVLEVEFKGGRVYKYFDVPRSVYTALINAPSKGEFINTQLRGYHFERVS